MTATEYVITAGAVAGVAAIAAVASYEHGYALVRANGEVSWTGRLLPLTVDELSYACSMVMLDSGRRRARRVQWLLRQGTLGTDSGAIVVMGQSASRSCPAGTTSPIRRLSPLDPRRRLPLGRRLWTVSIAKGSVSACRSTWSPTRRTCSAGWLPRTGYAARPATRSHRAGRVPSRRQRPAPVARRQRPRLAGVLLLARS